MPDYESSIDISVHQGVIETGLNLTILMLIDKSFEKPTDEYFSSLAKFEG
jgi:hypothetical protein